MFLSVSVIGTNTNTNNMGIPYFFKWFCTRYNARILTEIKRGDTISLDVDCFYIDMNGLIHPCAQKVYEYGMYKPLPRLLPRSSNNQTKTKDDKEHRLFVEITNTVENLVAMIRPKKKLVLCIDGTAPAAKMSQQRSRRFRSVAERSTEEIRHFDQNQITPGTRFMYRLSQYLDGWIRRKLNESTTLSTKEEMDKVFVWRSIQVVLSNDRVPSEGEHKIVSYIRQRKLNEPESIYETHCIHGLDADLFMLALETHLPRVFLFREDLYGIHDFHLVDMGSLRTHLIREMTLDSPSFTVKESNFVDDFVVLCFLVGNDFLPSLPSLTIRDNGLDKLLMWYETMLSEGGEYLTQIDCRGRMVPTPERLRDIFVLVAKEEKAMIETRFSKGNVTHVDKLLSKYMTSIPEGGYTLDYRAWRREYYATKLGLQDEESILTVCKCYVDGIYWVSAYYSKECPTFGYLYHYHYAPLASDLVRYMNTMQCKVIPDWKMEPPLSPFEQLLTVLPPQSKALLPRPLQWLMTSPRSPIIDFYPLQVCVDHDGKNYDHEGIVRVNFVDRDRVRKAFAKYKSGILARTMARNYKDRSVLYYYHPKVKYVYRSFYDYIPECHVKTIQFDMDK